MSAELDMQMDEMRRKAVADSRSDNENFVGLGEKGAYDTDIYDGDRSGKPDGGYVTSIGGNDEDEEDEEMDSRPGFGAAKVAPHKIALAASRENAKSGEVTFLLVFWSLFAEVFTDFCWELG